MEGKTTIILKGNKVIEDARLDNWGAKCAADLDAMQYLSAGKLRTIEYHDSLTKLDIQATPEGFVITTPVPVLSDTDIHTNEHRALYEMSMVEKPMWTVRGHVPDYVGFPESSRHAHQVGVIGLQMMFEKFTGSLQTLLFQSLLLARDLITAMLTPVSQGTEIHVSTRPTPKSRVPKVSISYTGCFEPNLDRTLGSRVVSLLQGSATCMQLLQLSLADSKQWQRDWYAMTSEEKSSADHLCSSLFGPLSSFDPAIAYMHITVLLQATSEPRDAVITRFSLGIDTRPAPECAKCQRRVVSIDSMSEMGAVRVNLPLQAAWQGRWEPHHFDTKQALDIAGWRECMYALRGWFVKIPFSHATQGWTEHRDEQKFWDPMDANNVLKVFQPFGMAKPVGCCAYNHVDCICNCGTEFDTTISVHTAADGVFDVNPGDVSAFDINPTDTKTFDI
jgi:hypothetical protein